MMDLLKTYDEQLTLWINQHNAPWLDEFMWFISGSTLYLLLILIFVYRTNRNFGLRGMWTLLAFLLITFAISDLVSTRLFKETIMRFRPSHTPGLSDMLHYYLMPKGEYYKGGDYGFVSSHASNFASLLTFFALSLKPSQKWIVMMLFVHLLVIYSRVYLGVHFVGDVLAGSLVGLVCGWLIWKLYLALMSGKIRNKNNQV